MESKFENKIEINSGKIETCQKILDEYKDLIEKALLDKVNHLNVEMDRIKNIENF